MQHFGSESVSSLGSATVSRRSFLRKSASVSVATGLGARLLGGVQRERIKVGQIGVGHGHAAGKMAVYRESPEYEVVGVVEPDSELKKRAESSKTYSGVPWMSRDELLNVPGLQLVAVETKVRDLLDNAQACIDAGMHIHLDKPAGSSLPHFRRIVAKAKAKKLLVQMGYMYRYNPGVVLMHELLAKGWLGEPFEIHTVMSKVVGNASRQELATYPGGMMFELGCHIIDLVVGVLGRPTNVTPFVRHASQRDDNLNDNMLAVCEYPKAIASIKSSAQEVEGFARRHFVLCGTEGTIHIEPLDRPAVRLALAGPRGQYTKGYQDVRFPPYRRYVGDAAELARAIRGEAEFRYSYDHDDAVQETVLKASNLALD